MGRVSRFGWLTFLLLAVAPLVAAQHPQQLIRQTTDRMLDALEENRVELERDKGILYDLIGDILAPHFDFQRISRYALGKYWRRADEAQRRAFTEEFRELLIRTYALALLNYSHQDIVYSPVHLPPGASRVRVATLVSPQDAPAVPIDYRLHLNHGQWKVYDVVIDGVSLVVNYRKSFSSQIARVGLDGLIDRLRHRNQGGSG